MEKLKLIYGLIIAAVIVLGYIGVMYYSYLTYVPELCPHTDKINILYFTDYSKGAIDLKLFYIVNVSNPNPITIKDVCLPNSRGHCKEAIPFFLGGNLSFWQIIGVEPVVKITTLRINSTDVPETEMNITDTHIKCVGNETYIVRIDDFVRRHMHDWKVAEKYEIEGIAVGLCDSREILRGEMRIINYFENFNLVRFI